ncbi:hypothetical protein GY45DRAFT_1436941 [Cubamyces sp. BRFM 1775]|nr:hypothetical protein GY45DRAFT_1436941 [Cubamyces sp. BRFM 1775]
MAANFLSGRLNESYTLLSQLCKQCNASTPINSLPPEILSHIFSLVLDQLQSPSDLPLSSPVFNAAHLRPLLLTCKHWNELILNTPSLWSTFLACSTSSSANDNTLALCQHASYALRVKQIVSLPNSWRLRDSSDRFSTNLSMTLHPPSLRIASISITIHNPREHETAELLGDIDLARTIVAPLPELQDLTIRGVTYGQDLSASIPESVLYMRRWLAPHTTLPPNNILLLGVLPFGTDTATIRDRFRHDDNERLTILTGIPVPTENIRSGNMLQVYMRVRTLTLDVSFAFPAYEYDKSQRYPGASAKHWEELSVGPNGYDNYDDAAEKRHPRSSATRYAPAPGEPALLARHGIRPALRSSIVLTTTRELTIRSDVGWLALEPYHPKRETTRVPKVLCPALKTLGVDAGGFVLYGRGEESVSRKLVELVSARAAGHPLERVLFL